MDRRVKPGDDVNNDPLAHSSPQPDAFPQLSRRGLETRGDMVALVGPNGAGKTNCLEAISFLSPGRGLRRATLEDVADNQGDGSWAVSAEVEGALGLATLGTGIDAAQGEARTRPDAAASTANRSARPLPSAIICAWCG